MTSLTLTIPESMQRLIDAQPTTPFFGSPHQYNLRNIGIDFEVDSQLQAIRRLLDRNKAADIELTKQIELAKQTAENSDGLANEFAIGDLESLARDSVFQDAAHSMAAVGMLAPFLETVFTECFRRIGSKWPTGKMPSDEHDRWQSSHAIQWDCHNVIAKGHCRKDLVAGILQIADAINLRPRLSPDIEKTLSALFGYRNKMFHCGFEWPAEERIAFQRTIDEKKWPKTWFQNAKIGDEPWIYYLSDEFIEHCLKFAEQVLTAFGEFIRVDLPAKRKAFGEVPL